MTCPKCQSENFGQSLLHSPLRIDSILVRIGQWECESCGYTRPILAKQPLSNVREVFAKSITCHACNDSGFLDIRSVRRFVMEDYFASDPPIICKRCSKAPTGPYWDFVTGEECDKIHQVVVFESIQACDSDRDFSGEIKSLADSKRF